MQPPGSLCQHGAQHHHPALGVGGTNAVPTRDRRGLFTQEGVRRCEKGPACPSSRYLSLGCAKGLRRGSLGSYQLQTFICLRAARPPSGGLLPTPALLLPPPQPGPQVSPSLLLLAARPGGVGSLQLPRATLSQHGNNSGTRSCVCAAPGHRVQASGVSAVLFSTLQGRLEKHDAPPVPTKIGVQESRGDPGTLRWVNMVLLLRSPSLGHFLLAQHSELLPPELQGSADTWGALGCGPPLHWGVLRGPSWATVGAGQGPSRDSGSRAGLFHSGSTPASSRRAQGRAGSWWCAPQTPTPGGFTPLIPSREEAKGGLGRQPKGSTAGCLPPHFLQRPMAAILPRITHISFSPGYF